MYYAILSAFLLFLSFPQFDIWILGWIFTVPFLYGLRNRSGRSALVYGMVFGIHFAIFILYSISILTLPGFIVFVLYLSLFYGLCSYLITFIRDRTNLREFVIFPVVWVVMEEVMSWGYMGFTLMNAGLSQHSFLPVIQVASITGVRGVSFIIVLFGSLIYTSIIEKKWMDKLRYSGFALVFGAVVIFSGNLSIPEFVSPEEGGDLKVGVVQGNIAQEVKWDTRFRQIMLDRYLNKSRLLINRDDVELIVWPETAIPFIMEGSDQRFSEITEFLKRGDIYLLSGVQRKIIEDDEAKSYNSAVMFDMKGQITTTYDKIHLVPFSETIPDMFKWKALDSYFEEASDFTPGKEEVIFDIGSGKFGVLICFESIFSDMSGTLVRGGADFLIVITNDAWFGKTNMPYIHASASKFRAVENRIWVVRAANTGVSAFYDPAGRELMATDIYRSGTISGYIEFVKGDTFYSRYEFVFPATLISLFIFLLAYSIYNRYFKKFLLRRGEF